MKKQLLLLFLILSVVLTNSCLKEHSYENGNGPSQGTLQDDGTGDCLPKTVNGSYVVGTILEGNVNYIEVQVDVTAAALILFIQTLSTACISAEPVYLQRRGCKR